MKVSKAINGKSNTIGIDVFTPHLERTSSAPAASSGSATTRVKPAPQAAPVEDAPPAWTKRADLPDGKLARGWQHLLAFGHDLVVTIAKH